MKRLLLLSCLALLVFMSACGCGAGVPDAEPDKADIIINIVNNARFDFHAVSVNTAKTMEVVSRADGSKIRKGETLRIAYIDSGNFDAEGKATFKFVVTDKDGNVIPLEQNTVELARDNEYFFEISGDSVTEGILVFREVRPT